MEATIKEQVKNIFKSNVFETALELTRNLRGEYIRESGVKSWNVLATYYKNVNIQPEDVVAEPDSLAQEDSDRPPFISQNEVNMEKYKIPQIRLSYVADVKADTNSVKMSSEGYRLLLKSYEEDDIDYREYFKVMYLNRARKVIGIHTISMGGSAATVVDVKMIFSGALLANAQAIILCHNHPSGTLRPSHHDDCLTRKIVEAGKLLDIVVNDHIIVTRTGYYSYADEGRL